MDDSEDLSVRGNIAPLIAQIERERGVDLTQYRTSYVERRLGTRLRALGLPTYRDYATYLTTQHAEYARLLDALTVNVTDFFRDPPVWDVIRGTVIPEILSRKAASGQHAVRAWSAGCATGEEAYSIVMSVLAARGPRPERLLLSVIATDLDPIALKTAAQAEYDIGKIDHIPTAERMRFVTAEERRFRITPEVTEKVRFRTLDLFADEPPRALDLILCRNVFIYFTREQQERVTEVFCRALARGGYLVLGRTEKMAAESAKHFQPVSGRERVYRKA
ncbi:MAG TPA: protein-glutamate O-methyltransferase CheR [Propionibacteriaceae bacterium]